MTCFEKKQRKRHDKIVCRHYSMHDSIRWKPLMFCCAKLMRNAFLVMFHTSRECYERMYVAGNLHSFERFKYVYCRMFGPTNSLMCLVCLVYKQKGCQRKFVKECSVAREIRRVVMFLGRCLGNILKWGESAFAHFLHAFLHQVEHVPHISKIAKIFSVAMST